MSLPVVPVQSHNDSTKNFEHIKAYGVPLLFLDHDPTDGDFPTPPRDGTAAINGSTFVLWFRAGGVWKKSAAFT